MTAPVNQVDRVRIRPGHGPGAAARAARLARIAHQRLGEALDRAFAGAGDLVLDRVVVTFPVDPDELDDEAVALLWAGLVRDGADRAGLGAAQPFPDEEVASPAAEGAPRDGGAPRPGPAGPAAPGAPTAPDGARPEQAQEVAHPVHATARPRPGRPSADAAGAPADENVLAPQETAPTEIARTTGPATGPQRPAPAAGARPDPPPSEGSPPSPDLPQGTGPTAAAQAVPAAARPAGPPATPARAAVAAVADPPGERAATSAWGGLVLLHYRLRPFLERACTDTAPDELVAHRVVALAALTGDPTAVGDPLVRLLAADPDWSRPAPLRPAPRERPDDDAEALLRAFAGDLPGFAASSPDFVREQWLRRGASAVEDRDAVLVVLARRPLDLLLARLPYPYGALRLPWTPSVFVALERP